MQKCNTQTCNKFTCRGFALALPMVLAFTYAFLTQDANSANPDKTNAMIHQCVDAEFGSGHDGRACIGRVTGPCKSDPANAHNDDQMQCDEREFVLWSQLVQKEFAALEGMLDLERRDKLRKSQDLWIAYQSTDCRLPYALFKADKAAAAGPACTIELKAARALQLRAWREVLLEKN